MMEALLSKIQSQNLDGILITKPENINYLTGFCGSFGLVLLEKKGRLSLITDGRYREVAENICVKKGFEFISFDPQFKDFSQNLKGVWGYENTASLAQFESHKKQFNKLKFTIISGFIETLRRQKNKDEIQKITQAQKHVDKILIPFLKSNTKEGILEKQLKFKLDQTLQDQGNYGLSFDSIIAFGSNSARAHHVSDERMLKKNDNILVDCGVIFEGYCSDMTRNFTFEKPSAKYLNDYEDLLKIQTEACQKFITGAETSDIDLWVRDQMGKKSKFYTHSLGHGVGLEIHETPGISIRQKNTLQRKEIVTCEPGYYRSGEFGIRIEDLILVGDKSPQILSTTTKELINLS